MIQDKVEEFFSKIEYVFFSGIRDKDPVVMFHYHKSHEEEFNSAETYQNIYEYFKDRVVKFVIRISGEGDIYLSLIDLNNGDTININNTQFITGNFEEFLQEVPTDRKIGLMMAMGKGKHFLIPQEMMKHPPVLFDGYSVVYEE